MEILVHFDMWNENRKILSSIFHFTSLHHTPLYENSQKWGKIQSWICLNIFPENKMDMNLWCKSKGASP